MNQTIVALATPGGVSALAVIRISGALVTEIAAKILCRTGLEDRKVYYGKAVNPENNEEIDSLVYLFFKGPRSYTGEDSLELFPHGNPLIVRELIRTVTAIKGVRLAEPGEFTKRAFLNGKLDLVQAESVAEIIHSATRAGLSNARRLLSGKFSNQVKTLAEKIKHISARLELEVDFVEEELEADLPGWQTELEAIRDLLLGLLRNFKSAELGNRLPRIVLYGKPNAGKSSLINAFLEDDRLLVSAVPGTTRDFIEVPFLLPDGEALLVDTAGIADQAVDELDARSMEKSKRILESADIAVLVQDILTAYTPEAIQERETALQKNHFVLFAKADLKNPDLPALENEFEVSAVTGEGIETLKREWNRALFPAAGDPESFWLTSERQRVCIENAERGIGKALDLMEALPAVELLAFELQVVRRELQAVVGEISSEDILQSIFSEFCIGK
ncbi:MAG: tRNA uridine-5-carboxymethylaminomethyl(34) synthesis GTPase MnmE [Fibrobacter sp.]|nr:tRNA uridine-5-carboxymethylaminomethyl(34) synthesis GTPase MnmE [Fibrobacter sp.]